MFPLSPRLSRRFSSRYVMSNSPLADDGALKENGPTEKTLN